MPQHVLIESLEIRQHFAASARATALDPTYEFTAAELPASVGPQPIFFQAVPAPHDRTYLLALRNSHTATTGDVTVGLLTIIAVDAGGNLDKTYGSGGVALTGREIEWASLNQSGIAKLDGRGRLYVADGTRVMRFRANGSTDTSFARRGAAAYQTARRPALLCDIVPTDDGVLVATKQTIKGVERVAVQTIDRRVRTTWEALHDTGMKGNSSSKYYAVSPQTAQFARNGEHVVLAHIQSDLALYNDTSLDGDPNDLVTAAKRQDLIVTRFDTAGHGKAVGHEQLEQPSAQPYEASLGTGDERYPVVNSVYVSPTGRTVLAATDQELIRVDTKTGKADHLDFPPYLPTSYYRPDSYQLLADGDVGASVGGYTDPAVGDHLYVDLVQYRFDGTPDPKFGNEGVIRTLPKDYPAGNDALADQVFQGSSGRFYVLSNAIVRNESGGLSLRRV